ncbi:MAG: hypothetical protein R3D98_00230 [Candidatus Krumholzibacteriia bacterium]
MPTDRVTHVTAVRSEYTSARHICANLEHRAVGSCYVRQPGYLAPEIDYRTASGHAATLRVRDYDVRFLERIAPEQATAHLDRIHHARLGDPDARAALNRHARALQPELSARFVRADLVEDDCVVPYTTDRDYPVAQISSKGSVLLDLSRKGFATPDFVFLTANAYGLPADQRQVRLQQAIHDLEILSGRHLGDPRNPLLIAMRTAMPRYLPGFMPTYLNVGLVPAIEPGLPGRYGNDAVARMRLANRRTILEALDPAVSAVLEEHIRHDLTRAQNQELTAHIESLIASRDPRLLDDAAYQAAFFLDCAYRFYDQHVDALRNFMDDEVAYPTVIVQRMVCSVMDRDSYAGVLYSRHPRLGTGVHLQYARAIYGEDLMTGRLAPDETHLPCQEDARAEFPAVHHFWPRLAQLEAIFGAPVMVEFTGVHGTFTILQVNQAQLAGMGQLTAVMDLYRSGGIDAARACRLIEPFHLRQLESDAILPRSLRDLEPLARGLSVLPRTAVSGRLALSTAGVARLRREHPGDRVILGQARFTPADALIMQEVDGIVSLSPAAIHVVTTAQTMGIPALLDLVEAGLQLTPKGDALVAANGHRLVEGDWVTISSRKKTLYAGKAAFTTARLMRYLAGEDVELEPEERARFASLARDYREFQALLDSAGTQEYTSLQELGRAVRSGPLKDDPERARTFITRGFDRDLPGLVEALLATDLGMHLNNQTAFRLLDDRRRLLLLAGAAESARLQDRHGYHAGAFVIGCLVSGALKADQWAELRPSTVAYLVNEWVLHRKYRDLMAEIGERKLNRAREAILTGALGQLHLHPGALHDLLPLKLARPDLAAVIAALPAAADPQTRAALELLGQPWRVFFDVTRPHAASRLAALCAEQARPVPAPDEV